MVKLILEVDFLIRQLIFSQQFDYQFLRYTVNAYLLVHALKVGLLLLVHALEPG